MLKLDSHVISDEQTNDMSNESRDKITSMMQHPSPSPRKRRRVVQHEAPRDLAML